MEWLKLVHGTAPPANIPAVGTGDDVRVWFKILEQGRERLGQFEGVVIRVRGAGHSKTFTVRRVTHGVGVERVFPLDAPVIERIEVLRHGLAKRSRLYFLRNVVKKTRLASAEGPEGLERPSIEAPDQQPPAPGRATANEAALEKSEEAVAAADKPATPSPHAAGPRVGGDKPKP